MRPSAKVVCGVFPKLDQHPAQQRGRGHHRAGHDVRHHFGRHGSGGRLDDGGDRRGRHRLIDSGPAGLLAGLGITGVPAYIIAIAIGILLGVLLGECTGVLVAHFGMPTFIATLGMMKICRSVTQAVHAESVAHRAQKRF